MWIGKFALLGSGETEWIDLGASAVSTVTGAAYLNGAAYDPEFDALLATTEAVDPSDAFIGGFRYRADGALRVVNADAGVPAGANTNQGLALSEDGQLCYVTLADTAYSLNGVAVDGVRRVYAAPLSFALEFADLGAGVVDTAEAIGGATPTFTRATAATTVLSTGLIGAVASGDPRSYYDPTTLDYLGYLAEGARTNLCLQSEDVATTWTNTNSTESANAAVAPDGATTADKVIPDAAATDGGILQVGLTLTADATYTLSVFAKTSGFDSLQLQLGDVGFANSVAVTYNTTTGAVESAAAVAGTWTVPISSAKQYPNGWWRFTVKAVATTNAGDRVALTCTDTGDGANGVLLWGMQIEAGAFASTYIPTTTAEVARNADVLTYPTTGWAQLGTNSGTFFVDWQMFNVSDTARKDPISLDVLGNNRFELRGDGDSSTDSIVAYGTGSAVILLTKIGGVSANTTYKAAFTYGVGGGAVSWNGASVVSNATASDLGSPASFAVGVSSAPLFGPIRRVAYYAARLSNATLQGLTNG